MPLVVERRAAHPHDEDGALIHYLGMFYLGLVVWISYTEISHRATESGRSAVIFIWNKNTPDVPHCDNKHLRALGMQSLENAPVSQDPRRRDGLAADPPWVDTFTFKLWQADDLNSRLALDNRASAWNRNIEGTVGCIPNNKNSPHSAGDCPPHWHPRESLTRHTARGQYTCPEAMRRSPAGAAR